MLYALLRTVHLLSVIAWIGGMFFVLACLRPALGAIDTPAARVGLMHAALRRFFAVVLVAAALVLASGVTMVGNAVGASARAGVAFEMPVAWRLMAVIGGVMIVIFGFMRVRLFRRLDRAVQAQDWPAGSAALASLRTWVIVNLCLGIAIVAITRFGAAW